MSRKRAAGIAGTAMAIGLVLGGCSSASPGAAAVVGEQRISERELTAQVEEVLRAQGRSVDSSSQALVATTLDRMITTSLIDQLAKSEGFEVTQGELDATLAMYQEASGGKEALEQALLGQDLAPDDIPEIIRVNILAQKIGMALDPAGSPDAQSAAVFEAVTAYSNAVGTTVSPRYGTWDSTSLAVAGTPDDLSIPVPIS